VGLDASLDHGVDDGVRLVDEMDVVDDAEEVAVVGRGRQGSGSLLGFVDGDAVDDGVLVVARDGVAEVALPVEEVAEPIGCMKSSNLVYEKFT